MSPRPQNGPLERLRAGGKRAMAVALARIEAAPDEPQTLALLDAAYGGARAHVIGLTGPPGVGKSTLLSRLLQLYRQRGQTVGVIAVDPSSPRTGGALLGDRGRIEADPDDQGIYVRSMATRGRFGGLAALTPAAMVLMRAVYDQVIVETVGVGQSETEVGAVADTVVFCIQPGSGDSLQYLKAGIAEIPDVVVVTKADLGAMAERARADVAAALDLQPARPDGWTVPIALVSAVEGRGLDDLVEALADHGAHLRANGALADRRAGQSTAWLQDALREEFGRFGLEQARRVGQGLAFTPPESPFRQLRRLGRALKARFPADRPLP